MLTSEIDYIISFILSLAFLIIIVLLEKPKIIPLVFISKVLIFYISTYITEKNVGDGDMYNYFEDLKVLIDLSKKDFIVYLKVLFSDVNLFDSLTSSIHILNPITTISNSTFFVSKIASVFGLFIGPKFLSIGIIFSYLSLEGLLMIYKGVENLICRFSRFQQFIFFFSPTFLLWSNGILKEPILLLGLGFMIFFLSDFLMNKFRFRSFSFLIFGFLLVFFIKAYVLLIFFFSFFIALLINYTVTRRGVFKKIFTTISFSILLVSIILLSNRFFSASNNLDFQRFSLDLLKEQIEYQAGTEFQLEGNSNIQSTEIDFTLSGLISNLPLYVFKGLFRPFLTDYFSPIFLLFGLESLLLLILLLYSFYYLMKGALDFDLKAKLLLSSFFLYIVFFSFFLGVSINNLGTLIRYKVPLLPFFYCILISIISKYNNKYVRN